jgi:hypothetical protein
LTCSQVTSPTDFKAISIKYVYLKGNDDMTERVPGPPFRQESIRATTWSIWTRLEVAEPHLKVIFVPEYGSFRIPVAITMHRPDFL